MNNDYAEFRDIIRDIIREEIEKYFKQNSVEKKYGGIVTALYPFPEDSGEAEVPIDPYEQRCAVDLGFTTIGSTSPNDMILNKSGEVLNIGDSVSVYANSSGSFVNAYVGLKHIPLN